MNNRFCSLKKYRTEKAYTAKEPYRDCVGSPVAPNGSSRCRARASTHVFVASDGITVAPLGVIDGYADCVGSATPLNASTMNVTDSFMNGSDGRPYDKCGSKVVPFPQIFSNQHFRSTEGMERTGSPVAQFSHSRDCWHRAQLPALGRVQGRIAEEHDDGQDAAFWIVVLM